MRALSRVQPKLASTAIFVQKGSGALFRNDGACFVVAEAGTYDLMRRLAPELTGAASLARIARGYGPALRPAVVRLVSQLIARGIVRDEYRRQRTRQPSLVRERFATQLALIEQLADAPDERFGRFRKSRVLLIGTGVSYARCAAALVRNGLERLFVADPRDRVGPPREAEDEAAALRREGLTADVVAIGANEELPEPLDLVLFVSESPSLRDLMQAGRRAIEESCAILPAFVIDRQALMGPLMRAPACVVCVFQRLVLELCDPPQRQRLTRRILEGNGHIGPPAPEGEALASRLGGDAAFEAFKTLAGGIRSDIARGLILQTATSDAVRATFVPYSLYWCGGGCAALECDLAAGPPPASRTFNRPQDRFASSTGPADLLFRPHGRNPVPC